MRTHTRHHDVFGWWHLPNMRILRRGDGGDWMFETNSIGLRDPREFSAQASPGKTRILLFGDSFTLGHGVEPTERYSWYMESMHPELEVMNFGLSGSGPDIQLLVYEEFEPQFDGQLVMVNPHVSNIERVESGYQLFLGTDGERFLVHKPFYVLEGSRLVLNNVPVPKERIRVSSDEEFDALAAAETSHHGNANSAPASWLSASRVERLYRKTLRNSSIKYRLGRLAPLQPFDQYSSVHNPSWRLMEAILTRFIDERRNRAVVFAPLPGWYHLVNPKLANYIPRFRELAATSPDAYFVDVLPYFRQLSFEERIACFLSASDGHYSPFGHRLVATAILEEMRKSEILSNVLSAETHSE